MHFLKKYWSLILTVIVICGIQIFVASLYTANFDSDEAVWGLMAKHIVGAKDWPIYYYGFSYLGSLEAWVSALLLWVFNNSSVFLFRFGSLIFYLGFLCSWTMLITKWFSQRIALMSLLFISVPSTFLLIWTYRPIGAFSAWLCMGVLYVLLLYSPWQKLKALRLVLLGLLLGLALWLHPMTVIFIGASLLPKLLSSNFFLSVYQKCQLNKYVSILLKLFFLSSLGLVAIMFFSNGCHGIAWGVIKYLVFFLWVLISLVLLSTNVRLVLVWLQDQWKQVIFLGLGSLLGGLPILVYIYQNWQFPSTAILASCPTGIPRRLGVITMQVFPVLFGTEVEWWHDIRILLALFLTLLGIASVIYYFFHHKKEIVSSFLLQPVSKERASFLIISWLFILPIVFAALGSNTFDYASSRYLILTWLACSILFGLFLERISSRFVRRSFLIAMVSIHIFSLVNYTLAQYQIINRYDDHYLGRLETVLDENGLNTVWADYWLSYSLDYLFNERILFVPSNGVNRIPEYIAQISSQNRVGMIFWNDDRAASFSSLDELVPILLRRSVYAGPLRAEVATILGNYHKVDSLHVGHWIVWVLERNT